jgi:hypothetical protein
VPSRFLLELNINDVIALLAGPRPREQAGGGGRKGRRLPFRPRRKKGFHFFRRAALKQRSDVWILPRMLTVTWSVGVGAVPLQHDLSLAQEALSVKERVPRLFKLGL